MALYKRTQEETMTPSAEGSWGRTAKRRWIPLSAAFLLMLALYVSGPLLVERAQAAEGAPPALSQNGEEKDYLIGPGDVLEIMVWKEPEISRVVSVRLDGKISLPLVDDIQAAGSTLLQVKHRITEALRGYVDAPAVYVMLQQPKSKKIYVIGKVNSPGEYVLEKQMTLLQAVSMAGGFSEWADTNDIIIMRRGPQGQVRIKVDYRRAVSGKDLKQNVQLQSDDVIVVP